MPRCELATSRLPKQTTLGTYIQMATNGGDGEVTYDSLEHVLKNDTKVKVAGVDIDGALRGKLMSKKKFLGIARDGFGFCSVIFGWDMHDQTYFKELKISNAENGYHDIIAVPDLSSFRRIPWEDNVPFFLVSFLDPDNLGPLSACPRSLLKTTVDKLEKRGLGAMAGGERSGPSTDTSRARSPDPVLLVIADLVAN